MQRPKGKRRNHSTIPGTREVFPVQCALLNVQADEYHTAHMTLFRNKRTR